MLLFFFLAGPPAELPRLPDLNGVLGRYQPGRAVVALRAAPAARLGTPRGAQEVEECLRSSGARMRDYCLPLGLVRVELPSGEDLPLALRRLSALPEVRYAEPDWVGEGGATVNDTFFASQWHHQKIETPWSWDRTRGSPEVTVAVLDTGIILDHPEFQGRLLPGKDFVNGDDDPTADHPHGVSSAGLVAANADNRFGVAGVDHRCKVLPVKVLNQENRGSQWELIQGLQFAADRGTRVINMSLTNYPRSQALEEALQYARDRGAVLVACAGNGGIGNADVSWPGASPLCISVGYTTEEDRRANFSATGQALDLVAPGEGILTVSTDTADAFANFSGCSAAAPVVAGIAALLLAVDPSLSPEEVQMLLEGGAEDEVGDAEDTPGWDPHYGWGRVNARRSLQLLGNRFIRGDANSDGGLDISDALFTLQTLFYDPQPFLCRKATDANDDGLIEIDDPITMLSFLFLSGELPQPYPACGLDQNPDGLECLAGCLPQLALNKGS